MIHDSWFMICFIINIYNIIVKLNFPRSYTSVPLMASLFSENAKRPSAIQLQLDNFSYMSDRQQSCHHLFIDPILTQNAIVWCWNDISCYTSLLSKTVFVKFATLVWRNVHLKNYKSVNLWTCYIMNIFHILEAYYGIQYYPRAIHSLCMFFINLI